MAGLDTNVLVRWLVADDEAQVAKVQALHRLGRAEFADCLHAGLCAAAGQSPLLTFDVAAARLPQVELIGG